MKISRRKQPASEGSPESRFPILAILAYGSRGENWRAIDTVLREGARGLPAGSSLARLLLARRGVRKKHQRGRQLSCAQSSSGPSPTAVGPASFRTQGPDQFTASPVKPGARFM